MSPRLWPYLGDRITEPTVNASRLLDKIARLSVNRANLLKGLSDGHVRARLALLSSSPFSAICPIVLAPSSDDSRPREEESAGHGLCDWMFPVDAPVVVRAS
jgi:hypothetical protein